MAISFELAGNVVGIMVDKDLDKQYLEVIHKLIEEKLSEHESINLFCEILPHKEVPVRFAFENIKFKFEHSKKIRKMAMVTDINWIRGIMDVDNFFVSTEVKSFERKDRLLAIQWISH